MSMVTAMVSPMARPRPRMTAEMIPVRAYGRTTPVMTSQRVSPSAIPASRWSVGTRMSDSRLNDAMIGVIMSARTSDASNML